jgi:hypothetical protein
MSSYSEIVWNPKSTGSPIIKFTQVDVPLPPTLSLEDDRTNDSIELNYERGDTDGHLPAAAAQRNVPQESSNRTQRTSVNGRGSLAEWHMVNAAVTTSDLL